MHVNNAEVAMATETATSIQWSEDVDKALAEISPHILYTILLTTVIWLICFRINSRRDL